MVEAIVWGFAGIVVGLLTLHFVMFPFLDWYFENRSKKRR